MPFDGAMNSWRGGELRLRPGRRFVPLELPGRALSERVLTSTYYDTDDLRLAAGAVTLRRREQGGAEASGWQLRLPHAGTNLELEWEAPNERVPEEVARLVTVHTRGRPLSALATLRTRRSGVLVQEHGVDVAEVVQDVVEVVENGRPLRVFEEISCELVNGDRRSLHRIEKALRRAGAKDADGRPKLFQALDLRPPRLVAKPVDSPVANLQAMLRTQYNAILLHDPGTRLGRDPEELHDHRVAVRRLRAMLRSARPLLDRRWADNLRGALRPAGQALAEVRDLDVLLGSVTRLAGELSGPEQTGVKDIIEQLRNRRDAAHARLADELCESWYVSLLNRIEQAVDAPCVRGSGSLGESARNEHRRARKLVRHLPKRPSDAQLHEVRIAVKRCRYAAELASAAGVAGMAEYVNRAKLVQDVLGDHQDAAVATTVLSAMDSELRPAAHMAVLALRDAYQQRGAAARKAFPRAWRRLDKTAAALI